MEINMDYTGLNKVKEDLLKQQKAMLKQLDSLTNSGFQEKLIEMMNIANNESGIKKRVKIKKMAGEMILAKSGDIVIRFDKKEDAKTFFDSIK